MLNARRDACCAHSLTIAHEVVDPGPRLKDVAENAERRRSVQLALTLLPEEQRRVVELRLAG